MTDREHGMNGSATLPLHTPETERRVEVKTEADVGKTLPPDHVPRQYGNRKEMPDNMGMTQPPYNRQNGTEPPHRDDPDLLLGGTRPIDDMSGGDRAPLGYIAGWLVVLNGKNKGEDYRIRGFNTTIGRGTDNVIVLAGDPTVSRGVNCSIRYYSETKEYFIDLGQSPKNAVYVNGKALINVTQLQAYDVIKIGCTELLFVPLCGREFSWNGEKTCR